MQNLLQGLLTVAGPYVVVMALVGFAAGWGLGFLELLHVPFGTALGIYTFYVLLSSNAEAGYRQLSRAA